MGGRGGGSRSSALGQAQAKASAAPAPAAPAAPQSFEQQVFDAIRNGNGVNFAGAPGKEAFSDNNVVTLESVRSQIKGKSFDEVTAELKRLDRERKIQLVTHPAHYAFSEKEMAATFRMGGKDIHAVYRV